MDDHHLETTSQNWKKKKNKNHFSKNKKIIDI